MVGQYAIDGTQRLSPDLRREYSSRVSFGAEGVLVTDRAEWLWLGGERRDQLWEDSYRPVVAHATTSFLRRYQLEGEILADRSELEPWPRPEPSRGARVQVGPEMAVPCAPP
jgi:hypothetical protein